MEKGDKVKKKKKAAGNSKMSAVAYSQQPPPSSQPPLANPAGGTGPPNAMPVMQRGPPQPNMTGPPPPHVQMPGPGRPPGGGGVPPPPSPAHIQKILDENCVLIQTIQDFQNMGKINECTQYHQTLHRNLVYLAQLADNTQNIAQILPVNNEK